MAGHSKWANIKHRKAAQDAQKNKARSRCIREIIVAVQQAGTENNPRLQLAIQNAKKTNIPKSKIEDAIKKGSGGTAEHYQEVLYEAYAPHGVALIIEVATDNTNRTVAAIRSVLTKHGGKLTQNGTLAHLFSRKGCFTLLTEGEKEREELMLSLLETGIDEIEEEPDRLYLTSPLTRFTHVQEQLTQLGLNIEESSLQYLPLDRVSILPEQLSKIEKLIQKLEEEDDVLRVSDNMEVENPV